MCHEFSLPHKCNCSVFHFKLHSNPLSLPPTFRCNYIVLTVEGKQSSLAVHTDAIVPSCALCFKNLLVMAFCIVQTRKSKRSKPSLTVVPESWLENESVYWPPNNFVLLAKDETSTPDKQTWKKQNCKKVGQAQTHQQAEEVIGMLDKITDSEDALQMNRGTRSKPAKKQPKFQSKSYRLVSLL